MPINFSHDVALDAANDLTSGFTFSCSSGRIDLGGLVITHSDDGNPIQRSIGLPISAPVKAHAGCFAAGRRDWTDAAQLGQGGLGSDALRIVPDEDQHFRNGHGGNAMRFHQSRSSIAHQAVEYLLVVLDFLMQRQPAPRKGAH